MDFTKVPTLQLQSQYKKAFREKYATDQEGAKIIYAQLVANSHGTIQEIQKFVSELKTTCRNKRANSKKKYPYQGEHPAKKRLSQEVGC